MDYLDVIKTVPSFCLVPPARNTKTVMGALPELRLAARLYTHWTLNDKVIDGVVMLVGAPPLIHFGKEMANKVNQISESFFENPPEIPLPTSSMPLLKSVLFLACLYFVGSDNSLNPITSLFSFFVTENKRVHFNPYAKVNWCELEDAFSRSNQYLLRK